MESLLSYSPSSLIFSITPGTQTTTHLTLTNITSGPIAYKVKTTHIKRYCVRPNAAILTPSEQLTIEVIQQAHHIAPQDLDDCRDRFLLQAVKLCDIPNLPPDSPVTTVWQIAPADVIVKTKFAVRLQLATDDAAEPAYSVSSQPLPDAVQQDPLPDVATRTETKHPAEADAQRLPTLREPATASPRQPPTSENSVASESSSIPPLLTRMPLEPPTTVTPAPSIPTQPQVPTLAPTTLASQAPLSSERPSSSISPIKSGAIYISPSTPKTPTSITVAARDQEEVDYKSVEYIRSRVLGVRPAPKVSLPALDYDTRQRVVVERTSELYCTISERQEQIDKTKRELVEARLKLSDAQMATYPAYDVRFELDESARIPLLETCLMTLISGALLSLLLGK